MNTYTTISGKQKELTPKLWKGIRRLASKRFDGTTRLFDACWKQYREYVNGSIDDPKNIDDVTNWLDSIASEKVNNSASSFYIYGK
jgi:hypothetical protein